MWQLYLPPLVVAALISGGLTFYIKVLAQRFKLVDWPSPRKIHARPVPRLGGLAIVAAFLISVVGFSLITHRFEFSSFKIWFFDKRLFGVIAGVLVLAVVGILDDIRGIKAWKKLVWHFVAAGLTVAFGIGISYIRLPWGLHLELGNWVIPIHLFGGTFNFIVWGDLVTIFWIVLMINTLNFLDGLDGLAAGISVISALVIFFLSFSLGQSAVALLAVIIAGAALGFLPWNFYPARIFMGDSGSMFLGYILGVLSVISGGKLATAFLVLGIPVLDVGWVVLRRILSKKSPMQADKLHLHHRLLTTGLSQRQAVIVLYIIAILFGVIGVLTKTETKILAIYWLLGLMGALAIILVFLQYRRRRKNASG